MCEFCTNPNNDNRDSQQVEFAGFFSAAAIEAAVHQARRQHYDAHTGDDDVEDSEDSDGT